jgi:hypothetical protein
MNPNGVQHSMTSLTAIRNVQPLQGCNGGFVRGPGVRYATPGYVVRLLRSLADLCFARETWLFATNQSFRCPSQPD